MSANKAIKSLMRETYNASIGNAVKIVYHAQKIIETYSSYTIGLYCPIDGEPDLLPLIPVNLTKKFCIPKIIQNEIIFMPYVPGDNLMYNKTFPKIQEPISQDEVVPDMIFIPGLAFDLRGYRLGRGKGYYDKYMTKYPHILAIGASFSQNILECLPVEEHDRRMHLVITEHMVLKT